MGKESEFEYFTEEDRQMGTKLMKKSAQPRFHEGNANQSRTQSYRSHPLGWLSSRR